MMADMLSFLSTRSEGFGFNEICRHLAALGYGPLASGLSLDKPILHSKTLSSLLRTAIEEKLVRPEYPLGKAGELGKLGRPNLVRLTKKGAIFLAKHQIGSMWGFAGLNWAEELWSKGYEIQFLNNLTNIESHKNFLFAWHPEKRDIKILQFLNPREYRRGNLVGFRFSKDLTKPVGQRIEESNLIEDFVLKDAGEELTEEKIASALRRFFDYPRQHNVFLGLLTPSEPVHFGMPMVANFELITFMSLGFQEIPLIPNLYQHESVALELPISESIVGKLHLKFDVGKVNRWLLDVIKNPSLIPEEGAFAFYGPDLICRHNDGEGNKDGKCNLGLATKCEFGRTQNKYSPPSCARVKNEMDKLLGWSSESSFNV
jgi:hypothetical protein